MRVSTMIALVAILAACPVSIVSAQTLPWDIAVDSTFRVEFLFGRQTLGREFLSSNRGLFEQYLTVPPSIPINPAPLDSLNIEFGPRLPILEGVIEASPSQSVSGRLTGSTYVLESARGFTLVSGPSLTPPPGVPVPPPPWPTPYGYFYFSEELSTVIKPTFWSWEAAGLYHITNGSGYRHSIVAGYRQELWRYLSTNGQDEASYMRDEFVSQSPFLGLQTAMFFPSWKARFEVLGSPFMTKKISHIARDQGHHQRLDGSWNKGGFIEFQAEGMVSITPSGWWGLFVRYTYEELRGEARGTGLIPVADPDNPNNPNLTTYFTLPYDFSTMKSMATIGLNFNMVF